MKTNQLVLLAFLVIASAGYGQLFTSNTVDTGRATFSSEHTSMAIVAGNPTVCYSDFSKAKVTFARNSAVDGSGAWTVSTVSTSYCTDLSLVVVNGKPALSGMAGSQLIYFRNSLADGSGTWTPTVVDSNLGSASYNGTSLSVVDGKPAIAYYNATTGDLKYAINSLADGSGTWTKSTVDTGNGVDVTVFTGRFPSLRVVNGLPAISYFDDTNDDLKFARNSAVDGSGAWTITTVLATGSVGFDTSMAIVNGKPAISFLTNSGSTLSFAINSAIDGSGAWTVTTVQASGVIQNFGTSLAVIGGNPAIGFFFGSGPRYARNSAADGSGAWTVINPAPTAPATSSIGRYPTILEVDGKPAMICADLVTSDVRYMRNSAADASGSWTNTFIEDTGTVGSASSAALVSGTPAIAYFDGRQEFLKFARNSAADGSGTWTLSVVDTTGNVGQAPSLKIVNGRPAVSYFDDTNDDLKFAINSAADGSGTWTVTTVDAIGSVGIQNSLAVVNGKPAICYLDSTNNDLKFAINSAADGSGTWTLTTVNAAGGSGPSLAVVGGLPAISYGVSGDLKLARNSAADGSGTWTITTVDGGTPFVGDFTSMAIVNGKPAIVYNDSTNFDLKYAINSAADASGSWALSIADPNYSGSAFLAVVGGVPAIAYSGNMRYARNSAVDGSGVWTVADSGVVGSAGSLIELASGQPGVSLFDGTSPGFLKWARLSASSFPEIEIEQPVGTLLGNGSSVSFGSLAFGTSKPLTFLLKNVGTAPLTISAVTFLGANPGDFSVTSIPPSISPMEAALFTVTFNPAAGGSRSSTLRFTNNDSNEATTNLNLSGTCFLFTQDTDGDGISDAAEFNMSALGFSPTFNQSTTLVPALFNNANSVGLFTTSQVQALNVGTPLLQKDPITGVFTLTIGVEKSTDLTTFNPFPMSAPQTLINGSGKLEFQFTVPDNAAFFKLRAQ